MTDFIKTHGPLTIANRARLAAEGWVFMDGVKAGPTSYYPARDGGGYSKSAREVGATVEVAEHGTPHYHATVAWFKPAA